MTSGRLRVLRQAILAAPEGAARRHAAGEYVAALGKAPRAEQLLAHLLDALGRRYSAEERDEITEAVELAKARST